MEWFDAYGRQLHELVDGGSPESWADWIARSVLEHGPTAKIYFDGEKPYIAVDGPENELVTM